MKTNITRPRSNAVTSSSDPINQPVLQMRKRRNVVFGRKPPTMTVLMQDGFFYFAFLTYARTEFSGESLEFWADVENFKKMSFPTVLAARAIYSKYVAVGSIKELNIPNTTRDDIKAKLVYLQSVYEGNFVDRHSLHEVFDQAMLDNTRTFTDTYFRFKFTDAYAARLEQMGYTE